MSKLAGQAPTPRKRKKVVTRSERIGEFLPLIAELQADNDRGVVILGAAHLDVQLRRLLETILTANSGSSDALLDSDRPLGSFASRIRLLHRMDVMSANTATALHCVRSIRNEAAHVHLAFFRLEDQPHASRVQEMIRLFPARHAMLASAKRVVFRDVRSDSGQNFRAAVLTIAMSLEEAIHAASFKLVGIRIEIVPKGNPFA